MRPAVQRVLREEGYEPAILGKFGTAKTELIGEQSLTSAHDSCSIQDA